MKRILLGLLLVLFASSTFALDKCMSGSYYDPFEDGEGFDLQVSENTIVVYFYGYDGERLTWLVGSGANTDEDSIELNAYEMEKYEGENLQAKTGTMTIDVVDTDNLAISWNLTTDWRAIREGNTMGWCLNDICSGEKWVTALFRPAECE